MFVRKIFILSVCFAGYTLSHQATAPTLNFNQGLGIYVKKEEPSILRSSTLAVASLTCGGLASYAFNAIIDKNIMPESTIKRFLARFTYPALINMVTVMIALKTGMFTISTKDVPMVQESFWKLFNYMNLGMDLQEMMRIASLKASIYNTLSAKDFFKQISLDDVNFGCRGYQAVRCIEALAKI